MHHPLSVSIDGLCWLDYPCGYGIRAKKIPCFAPGRPNGHMTNAPPCIFGRRVRSEPVTSLSGSPTPHSIVLVFLPVARTLTKNMSKATPRQHQASGAPSFYAALRILRGVFRAFVAGVRCLAVQCSRRNTCGAGRGAVARLLRHRSGRQ